MGLPKLFVVGDSISMHYGPHLERMVAGVYQYARKTGEREGDGAENLDLAGGANGGDSGMVLKYLRFKARDQSFRPDVLMANCGLHDIKTDLEGARHQVGLDDYSANLREVVQLAAQIGARLVWVRSTPVDDEQHNSRQKSFRRFAKDLDAYNAAADEIMRDSGVPVIDLHALTNSLGTTEEVFCDHVHFAEPVCRLQAAFIAGYLRAMEAG